MDEILGLLLGPFAALVMSLFVLYSGWKRWWVFGWHYRETLEEKNEWKAIALGSTKIAEREVERVAERIATLENGP